MTKAAAQDSAVVEETTTATDTPESALAAEPEASPEDGGDGEAGSDDSGEGPSDSEREMMEKLVDHAQDRINKKSARDSANEIIAERRRNSRNPRVLLEEVLLRSDVTNRGLRSLNDKVDFLLGKDEAYEKMRLHSESGWEAVKVIMGLLTDEQKEALKEKAPHMDVEGLAAEAESQEG